MSDALALARGGREVCLAVGHTWPVVPSMMGEVLITGPQNDRCYRCGMRRVIHEDGSRTYTYNEVLNNTDNKEVAMSDRNIHNTNLAKVVELIEGERRILEELINNNSTFDSLRDAWADLADAIDKISGADMEWYEALIDDDGNPARDGHLDAVNWTYAATGDYIMLRSQGNSDPFEGPCYRIVGIPAYRRDEYDTMSVLCELVWAPSHQWPNGTGQREFAGTVWQAWRDFAVQS
jgi:hypothetical protein